MGDDLELITAIPIVYLTSSNAVRKVSEHCKHLLRIFDNLGIQYEVRDIASEPDALTEAAGRSGKIDIPQVFIGDTFLGLYEDIDDWNEDGLVLDTLKANGYVPGDIEVHRAQYIDPSAAAPTTAGVVTVPATADGGPPPDDNDGGDPSKKDVWTKNSRGDWVRESALAASEAAIAAENEAMAAAEEGYEGGEGEYYEGQEGYEGAEGEYQEGEYQEGYEGGEYAEGEGQYAEGEYAEGEYAEGYEEGTAQ